VLTMGKPIDANRTQAVLTWSQTDWRKVEKTVLRSQHRIFMAKVKGDAKGMKSLQRLLASSWGIDGVVSISATHQERSLTNGHYGCIFSKAHRCAITGLSLGEPSEIVLNRSQWKRPNIGLAERCAFQWSLMSSRMR